MEYTISERSRTQIVINNYKFRFHKKLKDGSQRWSCGKSLCKSFIKVNDKLELLEPTDITLLKHNHDPYSEKILNRQKFSNSIKRKAIDEMYARPSKLVLNELEKGDFPTLTKQDIALVKRNINHTRNSNYPKFPENVTEALEALKNMGYNTNTDLCGDDVPEVPNECTEIQKLPIITQEESVPIKIRKPNYRPDKKALYFMAPNILESFIERYRLLPCLWQTKSDDYFDRTKRRRALQELVDFVNQNIPGADISFVKKRIEILRACFRKELRKVKKSHETESMTNEIHVPKLWYFDNLMFLADQETTHDPELPIEEYDMTELSENEETEVTNDIEESNINEAELELVECAPDYSHKRKRKVRRNLGARNKSKLKHCNSSKELSLLKVIRAWDKSRDEQDVVGKNVATKLRKMEERQRIHAERLINEILYKGLMEQLSEETCVSSEVTVQLGHASPTPSSDTVSCSRVDKNDEDDDISFVRILSKMKEEDCFNMREDGTNMREDCENMKDDCVSMKVECVDPLAS